MYKEIDKYTHLDVQLLMCCSRCRRLVGFVVKERASIFVEFVIFFQNTRSEIWKQNKKKTKTKELRKVMKSYKSIQKLTKHLC